MKIILKKLAHNYWHAGAVGYAHLCADWAVGSQLTRDAISEGEFKFTDAVIREFIDVVEQAVAIY